MRIAGRAEALLEIAARTPLALVRLAWHLGNRHSDVQISGERLRIRRDHVLEAMLAELGAKLSAIAAPFVFAALRRVDASFQHGEEAPRGFR